MGKVTAVKSSVASGYFGDGLKTPHNTVSAAVCYLFPLIMDHGAVRISESQLSATSISITLKTDLIMPSQAFQFPHRHLIWLVQSNSNCIIYK